MYCYNINIIWWNSFSLFDKLKGSSKKYPSTIIDYKYSYVGEEKAISEQFRQKK